MNHPSAYTLFILILFWFPDWILQQKWDTSKKSIASDRNESFTQVLHGWKNRVKSKNIASCRFKNK